MKRYNSMQTIAVLIAATAMLVAGCTRSELTPDDKPIIPDGMGELTIGQLLLLGNETDPQASTQTRADAATNLPQGATLRLYAFTEGETDFNSTLATRTYTISANGTAQLDAGQNPLFLPAGKADIYLVGPIRHNAGTVSDPNMVDIAAEWGITPHIGADLIATYTSATITAGNSNPLPSMTLQHKMALAQVVVETNPAAVYENLVVQQIKLYAQPTTGTFTLDQTGGAITTDNQQVTDYIYPSLSKDPTEEKYSGTTVLLPQAEREMKIETTFECNQKNTEAGDAHPTLKYRQSGLVTLPLAAGTATRLTSAPITPVEIKWRTKVLPWNDLLGEDFVIAGPDIEVPYVEIDGLKWATGNLVAYGANDCRVGAPGDHGLYFQFGGLIGYKGGANGTGTGIITQSGGTFWGGASAYSANDVAVAPTGYANKGSWPQHENKSSGGFGYYYFNTLVTQYKDFQAEANALDPDNGIGDPCAYYLGSPWRLPKYEELSVITGRTDETWVAWNTDDLTSKWTTTGPQSTIGAWFGPSAKTNPNVNTDIFIPASGFRRNSNGSLNNAGIEGFIWSSSVRHATMGYGSYIHGSKGMVPHQGHLRTYGLPVRCVSGTYVAPYKPTPPTADQIVEINGLKWTTGNLVAKDASNAKVGKPEDGGLYFQFGSLIGWKGGANGDGTGRPTKADNTYYVGNSFNAADEVQVMPAPFKQIDAIRTTWPEQTDNLYYFGLSSYSTEGTNIQDYPGLLDGTMADKGVGDPCRYYLGDTWRMPTSDEITLTHNTAAKTYPGSWTNATSTDSYFVCKFTDGTELKFPVVGRRSYNGGSINNVGNNGYYWSSSVFASGSGYALFISNGSVNAQGINSRNFGMPVRCVSGTYVPPPTHEPTPPTADQIVEIDGLKWTTGNLVAKDAVNAKVGEPGDGGIYFQYGGLIGYKGGATGDGVGITNATTHPNGKWWNGAAAYSANDVAVKPATYTNQATWPYFNNVANGGFGYYYFNTFVTKYADFQSQIGANNPTLGIGDPCAYYLGSPWRLPKYDELSAITGNATEGAWVPWSTAGVTGKWTSSGPQSAIGAWFGPNSRSGNSTTNTDLFIPASGYRSAGDGAFYNVGTNGYLWSSSVYDYYRGFDLRLHESSGVAPRNWDNRAYAFPVRCVSGTYVPPTPTEIEVEGTKWATGNLVADGANGAKIGKPEDGGLYFQFGSLIGYKGGANGDGTGRPAKADDTFYVGSTFNAADEVQVYPSVFTKIADIGATWPSQSGTNLYYFGYNTAPYATAGTDIHGFAGFSTGLLAISGVGDPCRYYLGDTWRMPTYEETKAMTDAAAKTWTGTWTRGTSTDSYFVCTFSGVGELKFPAVGLRHIISNGAIYYVGDNGYYWSSSVSSSSNGYLLYFGNGSVNPQSADFRRYGYPVRCVSGTYVPPIPTVEVKGTKWATGNLVADGANGAKIGKPEDGGLYFQFGSLIGYKGGANGDGTGRPAKADNTFYVGSSFNAADEVQVYPSEFTKIADIGTTWPNQSGTNLYYFGYNTAPYATAGTDIHGFAGFSTGLLAVSGVGDPCRYYLGDTWRMPTYEETKAMTDAAAKTWPGTWTRGTSTDSYFVCTFSGVGELKFPAVGRRDYSGGAVYNVGDRGYYWSSSVYHSTSGYYFLFYSDVFLPQDYNSRRYGHPVRCVRN